MNVIDHVVIVQTGLDHVADHVFRVKARESFKVIVAERDEARKVVDDLVEMKHNETGRLEARVAELEAALRASDAHLSLLRYRASIDWSDPALPDEYDVDKTITSSRAALGGTA